MNKRRAIKRLLIPTERVDVYWKPSIDGRKPAVAALWSPRTDEHDLRARLARDAIHKCDQLLSSVEGVCDMSWLKSLFPEHLFASVCTSGLAADPKADEAFFWEAVRQFGRIAGCTWARRMYEQREQRELTPDDLRPWWRTPEGQWEWSPLPDRGGKREPTDILFANAQWVVTGEGLESSDDGYFIEANRLNEPRDDLLNWPLHMTEKSWVDPESFLQAFALACQFHEVELADGLMEHSFTAARKQIAENKRYEELRRVVVAKLYPKKAAEEAAGRLVAWDIAEMFEISKEIERLMSVDER